MMTYWDSKVKDFTTVKPAKKFPKDIQEFFIRVFGERKPLTVFGDGRVEMEIDFDGLTTAEKAELRSLIEGL